MYILVILTSPRLRMHHNPYYVYIIVHNVRKALFYVCIMYCLCKTQIGPTIGKHSRSYGILMYIMFLFYVSLLRIFFMDAQAN